VLELGLTHGWWSPETVLDMAAAGDLRTRARAAEAVCRQAVWGNRVTLLRQLARHRRTEVRDVALTGLLRLGRHEDVTAHLDDPTPLIRAIAREAARQSGLSALDHYRQAVRAADPAPGAITGLAEIGGPADAGSLSALLSHPAAATRAYTVRALHHLDAVPVDRVVTMLRDPAPGVVREATTALRGRITAVPVEIPRRLLTDPARADLRRAGYRLLRVHGVAEQLRAALLLANDPDPGLSRRAVADATNLARDAAGAGWRRRRLSTIDATADQIAELTTLTADAVDALGPDVTRQLRTWLGEPRE
jgi:hypothetical protein